MNSPKDIYCTTSEFKAHLRHYKQLAKTNFVHITEHGHAGHVLVSVEAYEARREEIRREARWTARVEDACIRGTHDHSEYFDLAPDVTIEYLGEPWDSHVAPSFDDDVRGKELPEEAFSLVRLCLTRLSRNPLAGRELNLGAGAWLPEGTRAYRLNAGGYDIIYGIDAQDELRVYGLIDAL